MNISVATFNCIIRNPGTQFSLTVLNQEMVLAPQTGLLHGLVPKLENPKPGDKRNFTLTAAEAFGLFDPAKNIFFPKEKLSKHVKLGEQIQIVGKSGQIRQYKVTQVRENMVTLDGNHPLAAQDLTFDIEILSVRKATDKEITDVANQMLAYKFMPAA